MYDMMSLIKQVESGQTVMVNGQSFNKAFLDELCSDLEKACQLFVDSDCQLFIKTYANHYDKKEIFRGNYIYTLLIAFVIGFAGGVFLAGIITVIQKGILS